MFLQEEDFHELKETLNDFHHTLQTATKEDPDYEGQADELLGSLARVQEKMKSIDNMEQLKSTMGVFGWDMLQVYTALHDIMEIDGEEFDFEEEEEEEEENAVWISKDS